MTTATVSKSPKKTESVAEIAVRYKPSDAAARLVSQAETPFAFLEKCLEEKLVFDAAQFLAFWLPPKQTIWWCVLGFWWMEREKTSPETAALLNGVVCWLQEPTDELRRELRVVGKREDAPREVTALCEAVFYSEGSISLPDRQHVAPPAGISSKYVLAVFKKFALDQPRDTRDFFWRQLLHIGLEVRQDKNDWILSE